MSMQYKIYNKNYVQIILKKIIMKVFVRIYPQIFIIILQWWYFLLCIFD